jgi:hypothetical protein
VKECTTHHVACDCREAWFAKVEYERDELRAENGRLRAENALKAQVLIGRLDQHELRAENDRLREIATSLRDCLPEFGVSPVERKAIAAFERWKSEAVEGKEGA